MKGRQVDDGTCLSPWCRRCHLHCHCWSLQGCCSNSEKDLETGPEVKVTERENEDVTRGEEERKFFLYI